MKVDLLKIMTIFELEAEFEIASPLRKFQIWGLLKELKKDEERK